uniref:Endosomal/lysosomal potassium channel TMEM175 n=1 Tax=Capra hircus TaxID=9925 RepID=A0A8C2XZZ4_CAPHI
MSGPQTPEPTLEGQADASVGSPDEDAADGTQHSHRMLSFSDALLSIIATVMILPVTHTEISPEQGRGAWRLARTLPRSVPWPLGRPTKQVLGSGGAGV